MHDKSLQILSLSRENIGVYLPKIKKSDTVWMIVFINHGMDEKKIKILKIIDFLSSVEIFGKTILSPPQIHYFQEYKRTLGRIDDEEKLDLVLSNVVLSINRLLKQIVVFGRNISIEQRKFLEKIDQFENQNDLNHFLNLLS